MTVRLRTIHLRIFVAASMFCALLWPLTVPAEQARTATMGWLSPFAARPLPDPVVAAFFEALHGLGWTEGKNLIVERRFADNQTVRLSVLAAELVNLKVEVILTTTTPAALAAKQATSTIPIVAAAVGDPIQTGLVTNLGRPSGNLTAISSFASELSAKRLQLLKEIAPKMNRLAVLANPESQASIISLKDTREAAQLLGIEIHQVDIRDPRELDAALASVATAHPDAVLVVAEPRLIPSGKRIADFALAKQLPSAFSYSEHVDVGGLLAYSVNYAQLFRRAAVYVDRILRGTKPADLPVEQPTTFELVINLKTAKALGLTIPQSLLLRADQVIE